MFSITKMCTGTNFATSFMAARVMTLAKLLLSFHCRYERSGSLCAVRERAQEPHFPRGGRVRTSLGYLDVQSPSAVTIISPTEEMGHELWTLYFQLQLQP